eukprot:TRINITY_DN207_c0_g1_i1.p1 TRINITY_DN207_c0_g1~~TRINITY_DN207_c0_g1_i1.p1  ORF type:complete len:584 (-),score=39.40 TRINITY_DN207_c0_g1_i1:182-1783(-)
MVDAGRCCCPLCGPLHLILTLLFTAHATCLARATATSGSELADYAPSAMLSLALLDEPQMFGFCVGATVTFNHQAAHMLQPWLSLVQTSAQPVPQDGRRKKKIRSRVRAHMNLTRRWRSIPYANSTRNDATVSTSTSFPVANQALSRSADSAAGSSNYRLGIVSSNVLEVMSGCILLCAFILVLSDASHRLVELPASASATSTRRTDNLGLRGPHHSQLGGRSRSLSGERRSGFSVLARGGVGQSSPIFVERPCPRSQRVQRDGSVVPNGTPARLATGQRPVPPPRTNEALRSSVARMSHDLAPSTAASALSDSSSNSSASVPSGEGASVPSGEGGVPTFSASASGDKSSEALAAADVSGSSATTPTLCREEVMQDITEDRTSIEPASPVFAPNSSASVPSGEGASVPAGEGGVPTCSASASGDKSSEALAAADVSGSSATTPALYRKEVMQDVTDDRTSIEPASPVFAHSAPIEHSAFAESIVPSDVASNPPVVDTVLGFEAGDMPSLHESLDEGSVLDGGSCTKSHPEHVT